jgi:hypothetical protein
MQWEGDQLNAMGRGPAQCKTSLIQHPMQVPWVLISLVLMRFAEEINNELVSLWSNLLFGKG